MWKINVERRTVISGCSTVHTVHSKFPIDLNIFSLGETSQAALARESCPCAAARGRLPSPCWVETAYPSLRRWPRFARASASSGTRFAQTCTEKYRYTYYKYVDYGSKVYQDQHTSKGHLMDECKSKERTFMFMAWLLWSQKKNKSMCATLGFTIWLRRG